MSLSFGNGGLQKQLSSQIERLYLLLNGRTLENKKANYEEEFKTIRCAIVVLAAIDLNIFEKCCQTINGDKYLDFSYRDEVANYFKLDYDNSDMKAYYELINKGIIKKEIKNGKTFYRLTTEGENLCYAKLSLLESLRNYFADISIQNYYSKGNVLTHTARIFKQELDSSLDPRKKKVDKLITMISNWLEISTTDDTYSNKNLSESSSVTQNANQRKSSKKQLLIVDDDPGTTLPFKMGLENHGFNVETFNDPKLTLLNFNSGSYDLALIDVRMEGMNGFELVQELTKIDTNLKICYITSFKAYFDSLIQEYPNMDNKSFIQKPISIEDLIKHIQKVLFQ